MEAQQISLLQAFHIPIPEHKVTIILEMGKLAVNYAFQAVLWYVFIPVFTVNKCYIPKI